MLVYERGARDRLLPLLDTLLRLRVAVHLLQLPSASQPEDETALLGWGRAQGVFSYAGSAQEQWTAMLSAQPAPPLRFGMLVLTSLADVARQLQQPDCYTRPQARAACGRKARLQAGRNPRHQRRRCAASPHWPLAPSWPTSWG